MPSEFSYGLQDLADLARVTPRTIRYYIAQGLLPSPSQVGPGARYGDRHLDRIRLIKLLQKEHLPLAEIRSRMTRLDDRQVAELARSAPATAPPGPSAVDYVRSVLRAPEDPGRAPLPWSVAIGPTQARLSSTAGSEPSAGSIPDRSQWDRIHITADIELHVRRPLTRLQNRRLDRLIAIARELLEDEPSG